MMLLATALITLGGAQAAERRGGFVDVRKLPGESCGVIESYWLAPHVYAFEGIVGLDKESSFPRRRAPSAGPNTFNRITWFSEKGEVLRQLAFNSVQPGFAWTSNQVIGINENWSIPTAQLASESSQTIATSDSRLMAHEYHPSPGRVAADIYLHGQRVNTIGPFATHRIGSTVHLGADGSGALVVCGNEARTNAQVLAWDTNGVLKLRVECALGSGAAIPAPNGRGALTSWADGGTNVNTYTWHTAQGKPRAMDINFNPHFCGWIPATSQSLFSVTLGPDSPSYRLIDWDAGQIRWEIPCPGNGHPLAVECLPDMILFAVAEPYKPGAWSGSGWIFQLAKKDWIRCFYAVNPSDGSVLARWQPTYPYRYSDMRQSFLRLRDKVYYLTPKEFVEINPGDILAKKNGWQ